MGSTSTLNSRLKSHIESFKPELFKLLEDSETGFEANSDFHSELYFKILTDISSPFQVLPNSIKLAISQDLIVFDAQDEYTDRSEDFKKYIEDRFNLNLPLASLSPNFLAKLVATDDILGPAYDCNRYGREVIRLFNLVTGIINKANVPLAPMTINVLENVCRGYLEENHEFPEFRLYKQITTASGFERLCQLEFSEDKVFRINSYLCAFIDRKYALREWPLNPSFYREHFRVSLLDRDITNRADFIRRNRSFINIGYQQAISRNSREIS